MKISLRAKEPMQKSLSDVIGYLVATLPPYFISLLDE